MLTKENRELSSHGGIAAFGQFDPAGVLGPGFEHSPAKETLLRGLFPSNFAAW